MGRNITFSESMFEIHCESKALSKSSHSNDLSQIYVRLDSLLNAANSSTYQYSRVVSRINRNLTLAQNFPYVPEPHRRHDIKKGQKFRLVILTAIWKRLELTKLFFEYYSQLKLSLKDEFDIQMVVAGSEGEMSQYLAESYNVKYIEVPNHPLNEKWQSTVNCLRNVEYDAILIVGSDDFISKSVFEVYRALHREGVNAVGFIDGHFYNTRSDELILWRGYGAPKNVNGMPHRVGESIGMGRMLSKEVLEALDYQIWTGEPINRGLDRRMKENLAKLGLLHVRYEDMKVGKFRDALPYSIVTLSSGEEHMLLDVKHETNVTKFKNYMPNSDTLSNPDKLITLHFGEKLLEGIKALPPI